LWKIQFLAWEQARQKQDNPITGYPGLQTNFLPCFTNTLFCACSKDFNGHILRENLKKGDRFGIIPFDSKVWKEPWQSKLTGAQGEE
jgi:hypothetical protein